MHDRGIVHRDVKPANLLIRPDGTAALTDFGIALAAVPTTRLTTTGVILGTPSYLAPEQVLGQPATPLSDVYSLGLVGYECVAGRRPFVGDNPFAVALQRAHQPAPPLGPEVPASVAAVIDRALAIDPAHRWAGAAEFADAAARAGAGSSLGKGSGLAEGSGRGDRSGPTAWVGTASPVRSAATVPTSVHKGRRRLVAGLAVLAVLAALAVAGVVLRSPESPGSAGPEPPGSPTGSSGMGPTDPGPTGTGPAGTGARPERAWRVCRPGRCAGPG